MYVYISLSLYIYIYIHIHKYAYQPQGLRRGAPASGAPALGRGVPAVPGPAEEIFPLFYYLRAFLFFYIFGVRNFTPPVIMTYCSNLCDIIGIYLKHTSSICTNASWRPSLAPRIRTAENLESKS